MDVIGNNIANVNTTAYKSQSVTFSDLLYQTTSAASAPNSSTAGTNAKQIGLGEQTAAITTSISTAGSTTSTGNAFDVAISGDAFFIVSNGTGNYFTRDGSFYVDAAGNLAMSSTGYYVMGWGVDEETQTIKKDTVSALQIMNEANMTYPPEATTEAYVSGILDKNESDASTSSGKTLTLSFYDSLGYSYTAKFAIHETTTEGEYTVELADILDSDGNSIVDYYGVTDISEIAYFGGSNVQTTTELMSLISGADYDATTGTYTMSVGYDEAFSDYTSKKVSGVSYEVADSNNLSKGSTVSADSTVTMTGTGTVSVDTLEDTYGLIYVPANESSYDPDGGDSYVAYYYYVDDDGKEYYLTDSDDEDTPDDWADVLSGLGVTDIDDVQFDSDGNVTFTLTQDFTAAEDLTYNGDNTFTMPITQEEAYGLDTSDSSVAYTFGTVAENGAAQVTTTTTYTGYVLKFDTDTGEFESINGGDSVTLDFNSTATTMTGSTVSLGNFSDINIDWSSVTWYNNGGSSTISATSGTEDDGLGSGRAIGQMSGITISNNGEIYASYDNGMTKLLGQIAVAEFANAAGLAKAGDNLYSETLNSGSFDGVGVDITASGGSMTSGALESSNVDLATEFTDMIVTQRGFQANSRVITVSDTMLEELINLKR